MKTDEFAKVMINLAIKIDQGFCNVTEDKYEEISKPSDVPCKTQSCYVCNNFNLDNFIDPRD